MATVTVSASARTPRSSRFAVVGQSLAALYYYQVAGVTFAEILTQTVGAVTLPNKVEIAPYAIGGSYASKKNRDADGSSASFQCDDTGGSPVDTGGLLATYVPKMAARSVGNKVQHLLMDQGQADAGTCVGTSGITPPTAADNFYNAWVYAFGRYRLNVEAGTSWIGMQLLGRHYSSTTLGTLAFERIRQKQLKLLANTSNTFRFETWDLEISDTVHLSDKGQVDAATRGAQAAAKAIYGTAGLYDGPSISAVSKVNSTTVQVTLTGNGETIRYPSTGSVVPCCFRFGDASANYNQVFNTTTNPVPVQAPVSWTRSGDTLTFTLATPITGSVTMFFPYDTCPDFDPALVIKGATSGKPLQSYRNPILGA